MPPRKFSRHTFTLGIMNDDDPSERLFLTDRNRFLFQERGDNIQHKVSQGDTLQSLASRYFKGLPRPAGLWWAIADFQPEPIHDPTIQLTPGSIVVVPSIRTVLEDIFNAARRDE